VLDQLDGVAGLVADERKRRVGLSRKSKAILTPFAFSSARTPGRFRTSSPKGFTPCVRKYLNPARHLN